MPACVATRPVASVNTDAGPGNLWRPPWLPSSTTSAHKLKYHVESPWLGSQPAGPVRLLVEREEGLCMQLT